MSYIFMFLQHKKYSIFFFLDKSHIFKVKNMIKFVLYDVFCFIGTINSFQFRNNCKYCNWTRCLKKSAMWRLNIERLSISFLGVFFPTSPLTSLISMTSYGWFLGHFVQLLQYSPDNDKSGRIAPVSGQIRRARRPSPVRSLRTTGIQPPHCLSIHGYA